MKIGKERILHEGKFLTFSEIPYMSETGKNGVWEVVRRKTHGKIVALFALTPAKEIVFVKQFRIPLGRYVVELPAGLADKKGETPEELAKRELEEETGYRVKGDLHLLLEGPFNSGMTDDELMIFYTDKIEKVEKPEIDESEEIEVMLVPLDSLVDFCTVKHPDFLVDIKILNVLPVLEKKGGLIS